MKQAAIVGGTVYIASRLRMRYGRSHYYNYNGQFFCLMFKYFNNCGQIYVFTLEHFLVLDIDICRNYLRYSKYNGSISGERVFGWFLCPTEKDPDDALYCCGPEGQQRCCRYWDMYVPSINRADCLRAWFYPWISYFHLFTFI